MNEKLQHNPEKKEKQEENQTFSSLLKDAKEIYERYKRINKTYNKDKITNIQINQKFKQAEKKYLSLKAKYENIKTPTKKELNELKKEVETMNINYRKYEGLSTIASIQVELEKEDKRQNGKITKAIQNFGLGKSIKDLASNKKNIQKLLSTLKNKAGKIPNGENEYNYIISNKNKNLNQAEKSLYSYLNPIKNFFKYMEDGGVKLTKKDLTTTLSTYKEEYKIQSKIYEQNYKKYQENQNKNNPNYTPNINNNPKNENPLIFNNNATYNPNSGILLLRQENKIIPFKVPESDKKLLNSENIENYSNIVDTFYELGLSNLIKYLPQISIAIGGDVKYNEDFLKNNELKIVLNAILKSVGEVPIDINKNLTQFKNLFKTQKNNIQIGNKFKNNFEKGSSPIEEKFIAKFIINKIKFESELFKRSIITQKNPT